MGDARCVVKQIVYVRVLVLLEWSSTHWSHLYQTQNALWKLTCVEGDMVTGVTLAKQMELLWQIEL